LLSVSNSAETLIILWREDRGEDILIHPVVYIVKENLSCGRYAGSLRVARRGMEERV
jgi:hypothetical protein